MTKADPTCTICLRPGHQAHACPDGAAFRRAKTPVLPAQCAYCLQIGHTHGDCPKREADDWDAFNKNPV